MPPSLGDGRSKYLCNLSKLLSDYMSLQPRRQPFSYSPPWEPQILYCWHWFDEISSRSYFMIQKRARLLEQKNISRLLFTIPYIRRLWTNHISCDLPVVTQMLWRQSSLPHSITSHRPTLHAFARAAPSNFLSCLIPQDPWITKFLVRVTWGILRCF
jgi:hypothetical protein